MSGYKSKKRKTTHASFRQNEAQAVDTTKPTAVFKPSRKGRHHTLSIALPGSIIANATTHDQKTSLAGHIARACAVFCVDEIVVFDDGNVPTRAPEKDGYTAYSDPNFFLFYLLSYLETPPHLRKALFPLHPDLRTAGALPSLDMPHHMKTDEWCEFREGVSGRKARGKTKVDTGLPQAVVVPVELDEGTRVTVRLPSERPQDGYAEIGGVAVGPETPREEAGYYWGYGVRQAASLSAVFSECLFDGGYDVSIGTSERGVPVSSLLNTEEDAYIPPTWNHLLVVFGGVAGIETAVTNDKELRGVGVTEAKDVFDRWVNLVPGQGSRTIRTEEAVWIGLTAFQSLSEIRAEPTGADTEV